MHPLVTSALVGAGSSLVGSMMGNSSARQNTQLQAQINEKMYRNRYQWTVEDMRKAGLNPILAATGGFGVSGGPSVSMPQTFAPFQHDSLGGTALALQQADHETLKKKETIHKATLAMNTAMKEMSTIKLQTAQKELIWRQWNIAKKELTKKDIEIDKAKKEVQKLGLLIKEIQATANVYDDWFGRGMKGVEVLMKSLMGGIFRFTE